ncbi:MAG: dynamin family protein [Methyloglobulus sp.]|nr:dynamin family protein [Methyloglobulus sp.]
MERQHFNDKLNEYSTWRNQLISSIESYQNWRTAYGLADTNSMTTLTTILQGLAQDRVTLAFVAEFSRGKTELINALFFAETGVRLLPSSPGRTTMCPAELFYDKQGGSYIRLLEIESRNEDILFSTLKEDVDRWQQIDLDINDNAQMQAAFQALVAVKQVPKQTAIDLGLFDEKEAAEQGIVNPETVEIPCWRHALISFPHPLLQSGLAILDTPGLNALGSEPELTLSMLPSAQAVVFVIAADTGVTKSDLSMWNNHVCRATNTNRQGLAVVMNKIDSMWDDLSGEDGYEASVQSQIKASATTLGIAEAMVFPVSAKQALVAKIRNDDGLLIRSRINTLETYLSENIIKQRQKILLDVISRDVGFLIKESYTLTEINFENDSAQLNEFQKLNFQNQDKIAEMTESAQRQQAAYFNNMEHFKTSSDLFRKKFSKLLDTLSHERFDRVIHLNKMQIDRSITTYAMKQGIKTLFEDLHNLLQDCVSITNEMQEFILKIHAEFDTAYGFKEITPQLFIIAEYQAELEALFAMGEDFRASTKTTLTEKSVVVQKLYNTLIFQARNILFRTRRDAIVWGDNVMSPIKHQILDHKKQIENRLMVLMAANESEGKLKENINRLEAELAKLTTQRAELNEIIESMQTASGVSIK